MNGRRYVCYYFLVDVDVDVSALMVELDCASGSIKRKARLAWYYAWLNAVRVSVFVYVCCVVL